jgi:hypothetical protein
VELVVVVVVIVIIIVVLMGVICIVYITYLFIFIEWERGRRMATLEKGDPAQPRGLSGGRGGAS